MKNRNIVIIGGDKRQKYLKDFLEEKKCNVSSFGLFDWDDDTSKLKGMIKDNSIIILPLPASKNNKTINMPYSKKEVTIEKLVDFLGVENKVMGGIIKGSLKENLESNNIPYVDFYDEDFIEENAKLTAFGLLKILLEHIDFALPQGEYAVLGYGRVAKAVTELLNKLQCNVTIFARNSVARNSAISNGNKAYSLDYLSEMSNNFDMIINTIPQKIIFEDTLQNIRENSKIIELASAPYGVDFEEARLNFVNVIKASGLPGKYTPKTAGELIALKVLENLGEEGNKWKKQQ